jgi:hypothetical protein
MAIPTSSATGDPPQPPGAFPFFAQPLAAGGVNGDRREGVPGILETGAPGDVGLGAMLEMHTVGPPVQHQNKHRIADTRNSGLTAGNSEP